MSTTPPLEPRLQIGRAAFSYDSTGNNLLITDADGAPIALDVTGTFKVGGESVLTTGDVTEEGISPDAATLDGYDSTEFARKAETATITGTWNFLNGLTVDSADVVTTATLEPALASADVDADTLDGLDSTQFLTTTGTIDADTLDGIDSTGFVKPTDTIDADTLGGTAAADVGVLTQAESATGIWNFTNGLQVNDADVLTTTDASSFLSSSADVTPSISDDGLTIVDDPTDINFGTNLSVTDDGDGTVTIAGSGDGGGTGGDAQTLDGYDSSDFWRKAENVNASTLDSLDSDQFLRSDANDVMSNHLAVTGPLTLNTTSTATGYDLYYQMSNTVDGKGVLIDVDGDPNQDDDALIIRGGTEPDVLTNADTVLSVKGDGRVGINTYSPTAGVALDVVGDIHVDGARALTTADEGPGNGLDADTVDGHHIFVQDTEPANPAEGDLWIDTSAQ